MDKGRMEREGWELASTTSGEHFKRTIEMYHELGFDVHTEEVIPEERDECAECYAAGNETIYRIYTRAKDQASNII